MWVTDSDMMEESLDVLSETVPPSDQSAPVCKAQACRDDTDINTCLGDQASNAEASGDNSLSQPLCRAERMTS